MNQLMILCACHALDDSEIRLESDIYLNDNEIKDNAL